MSGAGGGGCRRGRATRLIKGARPATQVVVLSAFESPELERQAREAGTFAYLDKGTMARFLHRVLLGAAARAVLAATSGRPARAPAKYARRACGGPAEAAACGNATSIPGRRSS